MLWAANKNIIDGNNNNKYIGERGALAEITFDFCVSNTFFDAWRDVGRVELFMCIIIIIIFIIKWFFLRVKRKDTKSDNLFTKGQFDVSCDGDYGI